MVCISPSYAVMEQYLKLGHMIPCNSLFTNHVIIECHIAWAANTAIKQTIAK